jgi:hypothetical protein
MTNAEKKVAFLLKDLGIYWDYEKPVFVLDDFNRPRVWAPDFYLVHFGIYIEVCGSEEFNYDYRRKIFDKNCVQVIFLHLYKQKDEWMGHLFSYLEKIMLFRIKKFNRLIGN